MSTKTQTNVEQLLAVVKEVTAKLLSVQTHGAAVSIQPFQLENLPFWQQMAQILISGEDAEVTFKVHFMLKDAEALARGRLRGVNVTPAVSVDFIKEYCNVVAGKVKASMEEQGIVLGLSLPFVLQGFNELFFASHRTATEVADSWQLVTSEAKIICSVGVLVVNPRIADKLARVQAATDQGAETGSALEIF